MKLLDRYLQAVKGNLPHYQRDDIIEEISADILAQADERENELGRPLSRDEEAAILKAYGHPRVVASRYWKTQYLIGPFLLPFYFNALRIVVIATAIVAFGLAAIKGATNGSILAQMATAWGAWWGTIFTSVGIITVVFAVIERSSANHPLQSIGADKWDPRKLSVVASQKRFSPVSSTFELIANTLFLVWVVHVARTKDALWIFTSPEARQSVWPFTVSPLWQALSVPLAVVLGLYVIAIVLHLLRPSLLWFRVCLRIAFNAFIIVAVTVLITGQAPITITGEPAATAILTTILRVCFTFGALLSTWEIYRDSRLLFPALRTQS
ncbi:MAG: hypothetical protein M3126_00110 [Candidatus Eremiobacteraeota bacterium]|nr:hypothetical protein [Candidatus Eremiobacteraeota bacterium]